ncbi:Flp pilus assembly protein CpaB [Hyphomicrobium methylovorum]|uniref:Flp pilus assembly protein CpaB n=1 Tax=Hyphomicrobium methylovorum TaxID=84 RepID=UPI0015E6796E|nr:Flp pilus assembly protein CpaB [Hyphomicrobium methylovorum]MBA2126639.1 Flp pilus assembly protein CpaB [Hyphomicrobium methylovorum]
MKRAQLVGFSVALVAAGMAYYVASAFVQPPPAPVTVEKQVDSTEVLVAGTDIPVGQIVNEGHFRWVSWPVKATSRAYITKENGGLSRMREISGSVARSALLAGEPITAQKLIKAGQGGVLAAILPQGMRAISTKIKAETAAGSLILPNDHVDVILIRQMRSRGGKDQTISDTLFRNVRVIAIGQQIEIKEGKKAADMSASTATLELMPRQAEMMALANSMGEITLSLRSVADLSSDPERAGGLNLNKPEDNNSVRIVRYGAKSRVYGVN